MKNLLIILVISILYTNLFGLTPNESITLVDPFECNCDDPSNQFIIDGRIQGGINISSFNFNNSIEDKCIIIAGQLNIDQDFIMNSWDVKMEPGAKIVVKTGKKLKVTASALEEDKPLIYPNPTSDEWTFEFQNPQKARIKVELIDLQGKLLRTYDFGSNEDINGKIKIDADSGIIFAKVYKDNLLVNTKKLIKLK